MYLLTEGLSDRLLCLSRYLRKLGVHFYFQFDEKLELYKKLIFFVCVLKAHVHVQSMTLVKGDANQQVYYRE